jgi:hypothetical protein
MPPRITTVRQIASLLATEHPGAHNQLASDGYATFLSVTMTYNPNGIANTATSVLNANTLCLFGPGLSAFRT